MNDTQTNQRQKLILQYLAAQGSASRSLLEQSINTESGSRITVIRDLNHLISLGWVEQIGGGKHVQYKIKDNKSLLVPIDLEAYFSHTTDERKIKYLTFNQGLINNLSVLFSEQELNLFEQGRTKLTSKFKSLDSTLLKRELERFTIELSWKSSAIEGNTYSLLETEELIKNNKEAKGKSRDEAIMILNHKTVFDHILKKKNSFKAITLVDLRSIHSELIKNLHITNGIRESAVGITGTQYRPLDNKWQIEESMSKLLTHIKNKGVPEQALILLAMIAYIQPFFDGNKRTSRMVSNAILIANNYFPLSYRSIDEVEYKKALILFYEQNNISHLKRIFLEQQQFAIQNYFL